MVEETRRIRGGNTGIKGGTGERDRSTDARVRALAHGAKFTVVSATEIRRIFGIDIGTAIKYISYAAYHITCDAT